MGASIGVHVEARPGSGTLTVEAGAVPRRGALLGHGAPGQEAQEQD